MSSKKTPVGSSVYRPRFRMEFGQVEDREAHEHCRDVYFLSEEYEKDRKKAKKAKKAG